jgi:glutamate-1-semialdehyde 2,1-aminomutase
MTTPDITVISKAIGGGYPVSAFGASKEIMDKVVRGPLFHGGVFSGNAIVMAAVEAVLDAVLADKEAIYNHFETIGGQLSRGVGDILTRVGQPHHVVHIGSLFAILLTKEDVPEIANYRDVRAHCDFERYVEFQHHLQRAGVYFHPNQFEPMFFSTAHTAADFDTVLDRMAEGARKCLKR